jgi:hypothetical protein
VTSVPRPELRTSARSSQGALVTAVLLRTLNHSLWALVGLEAVCKVDTVVSWLQSVRILGGQL